MSLEIALLRLPHHAGLETPRYATAGAAGMDLRAAVEEDEPVILTPGARALIPTGLQIAVPHGFEAQVRPRSGLALKHGITCLNSPGTIDSDYRGEVGVILANLGQEAFIVRRGERIAQLVIAAYAQIEWREVEAHDVTDRAAGGFGSTGALSLAKPKSVARPPLAALKDVRLADGPVQLFEGVDLALEPRVRACLVGRNGAGKSTLMRILAAEVLPDAGDRFMQPGARIAMVLQEPPIEGATVLEHAAAGGAEPWRAEAELQGFGLDPDKPTQGLSGGETRRAALARAFAEDPDLILLDEPTNHLDIAAITALEARLAASGAAALVVSHDRTFLERVTQRCFWLAHRRVRMLDQGFAAFDAWAEQIEREEGEQLRRLSKTIERETHTFYSSITARRSRNEGRARSLEALRAQRVEAMRDQTRGLQMAADAGEASGRLVADAKAVSKAWGDKPVVSGFSTRILRGDRVAVVGPNGAGKTTLVRVLLGEIAPDAGTVRLGSNLQVAYLDQTRADLSEETTLWEVLAPGGGDSLLVRGQSRHVAAYAKDFLFKDSQLRQPVRTLSGGERNRLLLARALARPANLMVLDEPTNDLDMDTLDLLEEMLEAYDGTLILVSHDRDFIDRLATSTIALDGRGNAVETPGGWQDLLRQNPSFFDPAGPIAIRAPPAEAATVAKPKTNVAKLSYRDQRRLEALEGVVARLPVEITALEAKLEDAELYVHDPANFDRVMVQLDTARAALIDAETEWFALEEKKAALG